MTADIVTPSAPAFEALPLIIGWELTLSCNLRCRHCGSSAGLPRQRELSLEEAIAICDQFPEMGVQEVDFTGGEPLLSPHWEALAHYLHDVEIRTKILSNGLTLTPDTIHRLKDAGFTGVGVSIDGLAATHDYIRGHAGLFERAWVGVERLANAGIPVTVITMATGLNLHELPELLARVEAAGVRFWQIQPNAVLGRSRTAMELHLSEDEYLELGAFVLEHRKNAKARGLRFIPADSLGYFSEIDAGDPTWRGCNAGVAGCGIMSDGRIKGCLSLPDDFIEGDLRQRSLWDIWFDPKAFAFARQFKREELGGACAGCDMAEQCQGGCNSISFGATGRFHSDPYCFYGISRRLVQRGTTNGAIARSLCPAVFAA